ncbi:MAG: hypothetical protein V4641_16295 [Pseudomonadota bacterium]
MPTLYQKQLLNYQYVYDIVDNNPGIEVRAVAALMGRDHSAVRNWLRFMAASGSLERVVPDPETYGSRPNSHYAVPGKRPMELPVVRGKETMARKSKKHLQQEEIRRPRGKAKQMGMWRDPLVAALFGAAVAS